MYIILCICVTIFQDALIVCFASVDEAKTCGIMNQTIKVGKSLCNTIYNTIKEKSPKDLILTIEKNISDHLRKNQDFLIETKLVVHERYIIIFIILFFNLLIFFYIICILKVMMKRTIIMNVMKYIQILFKNN